MSFRKSKLKIGYPINNIPVWVELKKKHEEYGYIYTDLEIIKSIKDIKNKYKKTFNPTAPTAPTRPKSFEYPPIEELNLSDC